MALSLRRLVIVCSLCVHLCRGTFILLVENAECFQIEEPGDTQLTVYYEIPSLEKLVPEEVANPATRKAIKMSFMDRRSKKVVFSKTVASHKGEVQLTTMSDATHQLCIKPAQKQASPLRLDLSIERGQGDRYYDELAAENKMDKLQVEVVKLNDELAEILNEADFMKDREVRFHRKAERINNAAIWWPILQITILIITAVFQVASLKAFFQSKNLY